MTFHQQNNRGSQWNDNNRQEQSPARRLGSTTATSNEQQVFVGSLPLYFTREILIECFSQFGHVVDAKIHTPVYDNKKVCLFNKKKKIIFIYFLS